MSAKDKASTAGCWSGLRALIRSHKSAPNRDTAPALEPTKKNDASSEPPPTYCNLSQTTEPSASYVGNCCGWSTLQQEKAILGPVGELKLLSPEATDTIDQEVNKLDTSLREINLKIHGEFSLIFYCFLLIMNTCVCCGQTTRS